MEDLWNSVDLVQEQKCYVAFNKSKDIFIRLFHWLDRDQDKMITPEDMIYGMSRIMIRDVSLKEVAKVFSVFDTKKTGKISQDNFLLAIANGLLDDSLKDELLTSTYLQ
jgi:Ca2+-binding EF-hand superfamily protein